MSKRRRKSCPCSGAAESVQNFLPKSVLETWDGEEWTPITAITATRRRRDDPDHELLSIEARAGAVDVTAHHNMLDAGREKVAARDVTPGDELALCEAMPERSEWGVATPELAEFLGLMAADGYVPRDAAVISFHEQRRLPAPARLRAVVAPVHGILDGANQAFGME